MTYDQASKLNLKEYSRAIAIDLLSGEPLNNFGNKTDSLNLNSVEFSFLEQSELDSQGNIRPEVAKAIRAERVRIEKEARENGTFMKAPNGKPSNLSEEQCITVSGKAFIFWFGDWIHDPENASKVVDENGEHLFVFHGSPNVFTEFSLGDMGRTGTSLGQGHYFTNTKETALIYSENGGAVYSTFLNI